MISNASIQLPRTIIPLITLIMAATLTILGQQSSPDAPRQLSPGQTLERELTGAEIHSYTFALAPDEFTQFKVEQKGVDVILTLLDARGNVLSTMDSPNGKQGPETLSLVAMESGSFLLKVSGLDINSEKGNYSIEHVIRRKATEKDLRRVQVERQFVEAVSLMSAGDPSQKAGDKMTEVLKGWQELHDTFMAEMTSQELLKIKPSRALLEGQALANKGTPESLRESLLKFESARSMYREIKSVEGEAYSLNWMANAHNQLGEAAIALENANYAIQLFKTFGDKSGETYALMQRAIAYLALKENQRALSELDEAFSLASIINNKSFQAEALGLKGRVYMAQNEPQHAIPTLTEALSLAQAVDNKGDELAILGGLAGAYFVSADYPKAIDLLHVALPLARTMGDKRSEALILALMGTAYSVTNNHKQAVAYLSEALPIARTSGNKSAEALALTFLSNSYGELGEPQKAREYIAQALLAAPAADDKTVEPLALLFAGKIDYFDGQFQTAMGHLTQALHILEKTDDNANTALVMVLIGAVHADLGEPQKALEYLEQALPLSKNSGNSSTEALNLNFLGVAQLGLNDLQKALDYSNEALAMARAHDDKTNQIVALRQLGAVTFLQGDPKKALAYLTEGLPLARTAGDSTNQAIFLNLIGTVYVGFGDQDVALEYLDQAAPLAKVTGNRLIQALNLNLKGTALIALAEHEQAESLFKEALALASAGDDKTNKVLALAHLAEMEFERGEPGKATAYVNLALPIASRVSERTTEILLLVLQGGISSGLGDHQRGLESLNQALKLARQFGFKRQEALTLTIMGKVYISTRNIPAANQSLEQALDLWRTLGDRRFEGVTLNNLGLANSTTGIFLLPGDQRKALEYFNQARSLSQAVKDKVNEATILNNIGFVYLMSGENDKALESLEEGLRIANAVDFKSGQAMLLSNCMVAWDRLGNGQLATFYGKQSVNAYQQVRRNSEGLETSVQKSYLRSVEDSYRYLGNVLIKEGRLPEAQAVLELLKDEEFAGAVRRGSAGDVIPYSKAESGALETINRLAEIGREYEKLLRQKQLDADGERRKNELHDELVSANAEYQKALKTLSTVAKDSESYQAVVLEAKGFRAVLANLNEHGAASAALYTVIVKDDAAKLRTGWVILVTPSILKAYPIDVTELEQTVAAFREAASNATYDPLPFAQKLYKMIFLTTSEKQKSTLAADLDSYFQGQNNRTLMWSLDGVLRYVPMAALHDGKHYLVESYRNVVFNTRSKEWLTAEVKSKWSALGLGVSERRVEAGITFRALFSADQELKKIIRNQESPQGILPGVIKQNESFTRDSMIGQLSNNFPVVHISSHFSYQPADFEQSFLLLGQGHWSVQEMRNEPSLFAKVDLVTLSACDTAVGQANGKDAEGFAVVAQELGAKAVIASLWSVDDVGTQVLMPLFYRLRETGLTKAEAFQRAQLTLLRGDLKEAPGAAANSVQLTENHAAELGLTKYVRDPQKPFAHPYYWAPFILIGNWQ